MEKGDLGVSRCNVLLPISLCHICDERNVGSKNLSEVGCQAESWNACLPLGWQIGRPVVWGLASAGEAGVSKVLTMLREELELGMALLGCTKVSDIKRSHVQTEADRLKLCLTSKL